MLHKNILSRWKSGNTIMNTYDICGSVRIVANSEDEALDIMDNLIKNNLIEDYHVNEIEVQ